MAKVGRERRVFTIDKTDKINSEGYKEILQCRFTPKDPLY